MPSKGPFIQNENDKGDWANPTFIDVYVALAMLDRQGPDDRIADWLNHNGFCNLTCCPECHVDDFTHVEGCKIGAVLDRSVEQLVRAAKRGVFEP